MPNPITLTDDELNSILSAAAPLAIEMRDPFLKAVAHMLQQECSGEVGPGTVARVCRALQGQFFDPPVETDKRLARHDRTRVGSAIGDQRQAKRRRAI